MRLIGLARKTATALGMKRLAWKLRKLDLPVGRNDLVLDVGSGSMPNPLANVLIEYDPQGRETNAGKARANGKALIWADLQRLPFRDGAFDYLTAFHVLEHVVEPRLALAEIQRVARAGYIETPNELFDFVVPYVDHRNRVSYDGRRLRVVRKARWDVDRFEPRYGHERAGQVYALLSRDPADLHVQCHWRGSIDAVVVDEVIDDGHAAEPRAEGPAHSESQPPRLFELATRFFGRRGLAEAELLRLLRCIECGSTELTADANGAHCRCGRFYPRVHGFFDFRPV